MQMKICCSVTWILVLVGYPVYVRRCNSITKSGPPLYRKVAAVWMPQIPRFLLMTLLLTQSMHTWRHLVHKSRRVYRVYNCTSMNMDLLNKRPDLSLCHRLSLQIQLGTSTEIHWWGPNMYRCFDKVCLHIHRNLFRTTVLMSPWGKYTWIHSRNSCTCHHFDTDN